MDRRTNKLNLFIKVIDEYINTHDVFWYTKPGAWIASCEKKEIKETWEELKKKLKNG